MYMISTSFIPQLDGLLLNYAWESYRQTTPLALMAGGSGFCFCTLLNCLVPAKKKHNSFPETLRQKSSRMLVRLGHSFCDQSLCCEFLVCPLRPMALHPEQSGLHVSARRHLGGHPTQESWILVNLCRWCLSGFIGFRWPGFDNSFKLISRNVIKIWTPRRGGALLFYHGQNAISNPMHYGGDVKSGVKYLVPWLRWRMRIMRILLGHDLWRNAVGLGSTVHICGVLFFGGETIMQFRARACEMFWDILM